jgi:hypothetical protein
MKYNGKSHTAGTSEMEIKEIIFLGYILFLIFNQLNRCMSSQDF